MRTSAPGSSRGPGFTLLELLVVVAIIAIATAGVTLVLRDPAETALERDAQRLSALLEAARAQSRTSGVPARWVAVDGGFRFEGVARGSMPDRWLSADTAVSSASVLRLGPEPIIGAQQVLLSQGARTLRVATDGLRPFTVSPP